MYFYYIGEHLLNMINLYKNEIKRSVLNKKLLISVIIGLILSIIGMSSYFRDFYKFSSQYQFNAYEAWLEGITKSLLVIVFPLIASMPYSTMLAIERKNNFLNYNLVRVNKFKYIKAKYLANFFAGGLSLLCIGLILLLTALIIFSTNTLGSDIDSIAGDPIYNIFGFNKNLYILFFCFWLFIQGAVWSCFSFSISLFTDNIIKITGAPILFYLLSNFILEAIGLGDFTLSSSFAPNMLVNSSWLKMITQPTILILISMIMFILYIKNERKLYE